jgi:hypothetical protein
MWTPTYQEYWPFPITVRGDLNSDIHCLNLCPAQSRLLMGIPSTSGNWWPCRVMVWLLETFILEEINLISKSERHDPSANTGRRNIRGPVRCITQGNWSQVSNNTFKKSKDYCQNWEVSLAVRRSSFLLFWKATTIREFIQFWGMAMDFNNFFWLLVKFT